MGPTRHNWTKSMDHPLGHVTIDDECHQNLPLSTTRHCVLSLGLTITVCRNYRNPNNAFKPDPSLS
jgi:hypothetical protein